MREAVSALGLSCIAMACLLLTPQTPFPGAAALLPCAGAALVIWAGQHGSTWAGRMVSLKPLRWVGSMSFSLYLWHWPALVFTRHWVLGQPNVWQATVAVTASGLLAWVSLMWVESPLRRASHTDRRLLAAGAASILLALGVAWVLMSHTWWVKPVDAQAQQFHDGAKDSNPHRRLCHGRPDYAIDYGERCRFGDLTRPTKTAVWGDSHGAELALSLGELAGTRAQSVSQITSSSCPPALGMTISDRPRCAAHNAATLRALVEDVIVERVILIARYEHYLGRGDPSLEAGLRRSIAVLTESGKDVVLVEPVPTYTYPVPSALAALHTRGRPVESFGQPQETYRTKQREALAMLARLSQVPRVSTLKTGEALCSTGRCAVVDGYRSMYFDDNHLSLVGTQKLVSMASHLLPD
jgi:hypothetical protein